MATRRKKTPVLPCPALTQALATLLPPSASAPPTRYEITYRSKDQGPRFPKVGTSPGVASAGDHVTFFEHGRFVSREVSAVMGERIVCVPLTNREKALRVPFTDVYEVLHDHGPQAVVVQPPPKPKPPTKPTKRRTKPTKVGEVSEGDLDDWLGNLKADR